MIGKVESCLLTGASQFLRTQNRFRKFDQFGIAVGVSAKRR